MKDPLTQARFLALLEDRDAAEAMAGEYLCFLMIGVVERFGQWRFAGTATTLAGAIARLEALTDALYEQVVEGGGADEETPEGGWFAQMAASEALEFCQSAAMRGSWSSGAFDDRGLGEVRAAVLAEGGAPYDDHGFAILEVVGGLAGHPYEHRPAESVAPRAWFGGDWEADVDGAPDDFLPGGVVAQERGR